MVGYAARADTVRNEAAQMVAALEGLHVSPVLLTGDHHSAAQAIAGELGIRDVHANCRPADKLNWISTYQKRLENVCMIGDGINDSPALSAADIGIAIHSGAAIAREIADVTIRADSLEELVTLKAIANALQKRVGSNYRFVLSFNSALILLGALGILPPATSAMLHNLSTLGISLRSMTDLLEQKPLP